MWCEFFSCSVREKQAHRPNSDFLFFSSTDRICLVVVWNVRDYNVYDALYAYGLHKFAYVFVIMFENIGAISKLGLSICSCLPNHLHSNENCIFEGKLYRRPREREKQKHVALFKNEQILMQCNGADSKTMLCCVVYSSFLFFICCTQLQIHTQRNTKALQF